MTKRLLSSSLAELWQMIQIILIGIVATLSLASCAPANCIFRGYQETAVLLLKAKYGANYDDFVGPTMTDLNGFLKDDSSRELSGDVSVSYFAREDRPGLKEGTLFIITFDRWCPSKAVQTSEIVPSGKPQPCVFDNSPRVTYGCGSSQFK